MVTGGWVGCSGLCQLLPDCLACASCFADPWKGWTGEKRREGDKATTAVVLMSRAQPCEWLLYKNEGKDKGELMDESRIGVLSVITSGHLVIRQRNMNPRQGTHSHGHAPVPSVLGMTRLAARGP